MRELLLPSLLVLSLFISTSVSIPQSHQWLNARRLTPRESPLEFGVHFTRSSTANSTSSATSSLTSKHEGVNILLIVGIIMAVVAPMAIIIAAIIAGIRGRRRRDQPPTWQRSRAPYSKLSAGVDKVSAHSQRQRSTFSPSPSKIAPAVLPKARLSRFSLSHGARSDHPPISPVTSKWELFGQNHAYARASGEWRSQQSWPL